MSDPADVAAVTGRLAAPFDPAEVKFKPAAVSGNRAMALAYVDARVVQDRLDEVLGVMGWQDAYKVLPDGSVLCRLRLKIGDQWVTKVDVGGQSEQPDGGDRTKAAFSDALKRAAVKFGVGRYLYRTPAQWVDYDPHKRQFVRTPTLPAQAAARPAKPAKAAPAAPPPANGILKQYKDRPPASGSVFRAYVEAMDRLGRRQFPAVWAEGELARHLDALGKPENVRWRDVERWIPGVIEVAWGWAKAFALAKKGLAVPAPAPSTR